jgi:HEAT repeat protein
MTAPTKDNGAAQACNGALAELHKALKALTFYPEKHPLREEILHKAYQVTVNVAKGEGISLIVRRTGLSFADRDIVVDNTPMNVALAKELFAREVQQLTLLPELSFAEFTEFLSLLAMEPPAITAAGGLAELLTDRGIKSVIANEIDISAVFTKKMTGDSSEKTYVEGTGDSSPGEGSEQEFESSVEGESDQLSDLDMEELIALMDSEADDDRYRLLARILPGKCQLLKVEGEYDRLFKALQQILKQNNDERKSAAKRENALLLFHQIALGEMAEHLLDHLEDEAFAHKDIVLMILNRLGEHVVEAIIRRVIAAENQPSMKTFSAALVQIGSPAVPSLTRLLKDNRWQVVRSAVIMLGEMGCRDSVNDLTHAAFHMENRVRMEAIRSLARIGGREATSLLIDFLDDKNQGVKRQTITWLGITRNEKALQPLLQLVMKQDLLGKAITLKKEAIIAIGRIGDRRAIDILGRFIRKRHLISPGRWEELKILAIETIGKLGGESSREFLGRMSGRGGRIGRACSAALESAERLETNQGPADMQNANEMESEVCR